MKQRIEKSAKHKKYFLLITIEFLKALIKNLMKNGKERSVLGVEMPKKKHEMKSQALNNYAKIRFPSEMIQNDSTKATDVNTN